MSALTFKGGVHPFDGKDMSKDVPIEELKPGRELVYMLSQHIGAPAVPLVAKGDRVLMGQRIAEGQAFISAHVHASVSGTVKAIEPRLTASGMKVNAIIVENDGLYEAAESKPQTKKLEELTPGEIRELVKEAGVVGMGGAGFPTHVKLSPKNEGDIDSIIVNAAECEPYLTSDYRRMLEEPEKLINGLKVVLQVFQKAMGYIAVEDNKPEAIRLLQEKTAGEKRIQVKVLKTKYPQGGERCLIYAVTGRKINSSMLPADAGCIVHNVDTIVSVYNAVMEKKPLTRRIVTVTGDAVKEPRNFYVYIGMSYAELVEAVGGFANEPEKIISGGPMMGFAMYSLNVPVTKNTSSLLAFTKDVVKEEAESACIRCGRCGEACPENLLPARLAAFARRGDMDGFVKSYGMECVECGCCSYVCPAKRQITQSIKAMRKMVMAERRKK